MNETNTYKNLLHDRQNNFPEEIILHHSGGINSNPLEDTSHHTAEMMEAWHLSKGWSGLGYHFVIHKDGEVWKGRPEHINGAHTLGRNFKSLGVCLAGNFDATMPTEAQKTALKELLVDLMDKYSIDKEKVYPHRHFSNKTCYGNNLSDDWAQNLLSEIEHVCKKIEDYSNEELLEEISLRMT
ncbi:MAG: peptidoglycan recognition protein family protein [Candidatus Heimdallarchaeaceae archaeon]